MQTDLTTAEGKFRRTVGDVVVAEMLFIQATVESASVIGTGLQQLGHHLPPTADALSRVHSLLAACILASCSGVASS